MSGFASCRRIQFVTFTRNQKVESQIPKGFCASPGPGIQFVIYTIKHIIPDSKRFLYTLRPGIQFLTYTKKVESQISKGFWAPSGPGIQLFMYTKSRISDFK